MVFVSKLRGTQARELRSNLPNLTCTIFPTEEDQRQPLEQLLKVFSMMLEKVDSRIEVS